jgi:hypothetical protein
METALVRQTYAGWCGGTAAIAASYPIRNLYKPMPIAAPEGRNILFISKKYCVPPGRNCFRALFYYKYSAPLWGQKSSLQILVHILKPEETFYIIKGYYLNSG